MYIIETSQWSQGFCKLGERKSIEFKQERSPHKVTKTDVCVYVCVQHDLCSCPMAPSTDRDAV